MKKKFLCMIIGFLLVMTACENRTSNNVSEANTSNSDTPTEVGSQSEVDNQTSNEEVIVDSTQNSESKILIAYFAVAENRDVDAISSASVVKEDNGEVSGLVRILAMDIQNVTAGDLFSIKTSVKYPGDIGDLIEYADKELEENVRPELTSHIENLDDYDVIYIGYPTWWYDMPMVMYSFFDEYDFSGKTIIPFNSHNGSRFSGTIETIQELEPDATVITDGFTVNQNGVIDATGDVEEWLEGLHY